MNPTQTESDTGVHHFLSGTEGIEDVWWPYFASPRVGRHTNKVLGEQTGGRLFQALLTYPRGAASPLHIHHDADETFFVLDGELTVFVGEREYRCTAGDFILAPRGETHAFLVRSERAEILLTFAPAGLEGFFAEVAPAVVPGEDPPAPSMPDEDEFVRLMAKYECEFVGPPPTLDD